MVKNNKKANQLLKTARGQLESVLTMVEDDRYCIDVSNQILAVVALLKRANQEILSEHMKHCVSDAFECGNAEEKIDEIISIIQKMTK